jgi:8-oxo-dGTP pyrophosphatase MutT (NUDIX family)
MATNATLCFVIRKGEVLLLLKSAGRFGGGLWNGLGGKLGNDETPLECVKREVLEESGLEIDNPKRLGTLEFRFGDDAERDWVVQVFSATDFRGEPRSSDEGALRWFALRDIPYDQMWEDDYHWLPLLLRGASFRGYFRFDSEGKKIVSYDLVEEPEDSLPEA